ncbi:MAG: cysteine hydrolase [Lachnospiraceae bacterium]|nr:cysteine hydrolase [Lachnospiraceae bacterium]
MKYLIIVDMQNDFITGSLGTKEAQAILPTVIQKAKAFEGQVIFTRDTHSPEYLTTQEGRNLPVEHCIEGTWGWQLADGLQDLAEKSECRIFDKPTFGSTDLAQALLADNESEDEKTTVESVELCGLCTDICLNSNDLLIKATLPEVPVSVDASCCAGVTPESHINALSAMKMCQVIIRNEA